VAAGFVIAVGVLTLLAALAVALGRPRAREWPSVMGEFLDKQVVPLDMHDPRSLYRVDVSYVYTVGPNRYIGRTVRTASRPLDYRSAVAAVRRLPERVRVHYSPVTPEDSYIYLGPQGSPAWLLAGLGLGLLALGAGLWLWQG
jgi:hypothetical protein